MSRGGNLQGASDGDGPRLLLEHHEALAAVDDLIDAERRRR
jgi:hypothetical protein